MFRHVRVYCHHSTLRKQIEEAISPHQAMFSEDKTPPKHADVIATCGMLSLPLERFAAQLGCYPVILPEGAAWLGSKVADGSISVIVGSDMMRVRA